MDDPLLTNNFMKKIIDRRKNDIIGLAVSKGTRLRIPKSKSKFGYLISLLLIMGVVSFLKNSILMAIFTTKKIFSLISPKLKSPSILEYAAHKGIKTYYTDTVNKRDFLQILEKIKPDIIINQAQDILKKEFLSIPTIGVLNRHNSLLPKNRGRLSPFWAIYKGEKQTGVSIHFVTEKIDEGDIVVQEKFSISKRDNFNTIVKKSYKIAPEAMLKALDVIEKGNYKRISNDNMLATYNSIPCIKNALKYRLRRLKLL